MRLISYIGLFCWIYVNAGCNGPQSQPQNHIGSADHRPVVIVSNYPLAYFAERLAGDHIDVSFLAADADDPAFWKPTAADIEAIQAADLICFNGAGFETWAAMYTLTPDNIVDTSTSFRDSLIPIEQTVTHRHGPEGDHSHGDTAFTTWIDFQQAAAQATALRDALLRIVPDRQQELKANYDRLVRDLESLDQDMQSLADEIGGRPLIVSHPVYQYWARRYDLNVKSLHWEPGASLGDAQIAELKQAIENHPAKLLIWENQPNSATAARLQSSFQMTSVVFDPCGSPPASGDWLTVMRENLDRLAAVFDPP